MKALSLRELSICILLCLCTLLFTACFGGGIEEPGNDNEIINPDPEIKEEDEHYHSYKIDNSASTVNCTNDGVIVWTCECGYSCSEPAKAFGHIIVTENKKEPTCTADGNEIYERCTRPNCTYTTYVAIPALQHDLRYHDDIKPTCTDNGYVNIANCTRTGCSYSTITKVDALGHQIQLIDAKAPTCEDSGYTSYEICTRLGCTGVDLVMREEIEPLGHKTTSYDGKDPNCTTPGWTAYTLCERCGENDKEILPALGHDYKNGYCHCGHKDIGLHTHVWDNGLEVMSPTCVDTGMMQYTCTDANCGDVRNEIIPELGHNKVYYPRKDSTCTETGYQSYYKCSRCTYTTGIIVIDKKEHSYTKETVTTPATCTASGVLTLSCVCGLSRVAVIEPLGHAWGDWTVTKYETCESDGVGQRVCVNDATHIEFKSIDNLSGHAWSDWTVITAPTCDKLGVEQRVCANDAAHIERRDIPMIDHTPNQTNGKCTKCGAPVKPRLATPERQDTKGTVIYWNIVEDAEYYLLVINGTDEYEVNNTQFDLKDYCNKVGSLQIYITAIAEENGLYANSAACIFNHNVEESLITQYANKGLGRGVNLLTGGYTDKFATFSIFDKSSFDALNIAATKKMAANSTATYYESLQGYVNDMSSKVGNKFKIDASVGYLNIVNVTAGYSYDVENTYQEKSQSETKTVFYDMKYRYVDASVSIAEDKATLTNSLSDDFLTDAREVRNGTMSAESFIGKYGTHIITAADFGASFDIHYEMLSDSSKLEESMQEDTQSAITASLKASIYGVNIGIDVENTNTASSSNFETKTNSSTQQKFSGLMRGGSVTGSILTSLSDFGPACNAWAETFNDDPDKYALIDVPDGSLYFVWDFLPAEYQDVKDILNYYFKITCDGQYNSLIDKIGSMYSDAFLFNEIDGILLVDIPVIPLEGEKLFTQMYSMDGKVLSNGNGIFTIYPKFNGYDVKKVVFKSNYLLKEEVSGDTYEGKFTGLTVIFDNDWVDPIVVEFENFAHEAPDGYSALDFSRVKSNKVTLIINGNVYMEGGNGIGENDPCMMPINWGSVSEREIIGEENLHLVNGTLRETTIKFGEGDNARFWLKWHENIFQGYRHDNIAEVIYPNFDIQKLINDGYTKLSVTLTFRYYVDDAGYQRIQIFSHKDELVNEFKYTWQESGWTTHTITFELDLSTQVQVDGSFWMTWGFYENGNSKDTWAVGETIFDIEAIKPTAEESEDNITQ